MLTAAAVVTLVTVLLNAELDLRRAWVLRQHDGGFEYRSPSAVVSRIAALDHRPLAADMLWIALTITHSQSVSIQGRAAEHLLTNAIVLSEVDPYFYRPYEWVPGAFLGRRYPISSEDLADVSAYMDRAIAVYPDDVELHRSAALNYVGYGRGFSEETYQAHSMKAVYYLEEAAKIAPDDPQIPSMLAYFRKRAERYGGEPDPEAERVFWTDLLRRARDEGTRERALRALKSLGVEAADPRHVLDPAIPVRHQRDAPYMPFELYLLIGAADDAGD